MSTLAQVVAASTASSEKAAKISANSPLYLRFPSVWTGGGATVGRACIAIAAKSGLADSSTGSIGSAGQNMFIGISQGDTGAPYVPPVVPSAGFDISGESRKVIGVSARVGGTYTNYKSSNQFSRWFGEVPILRFNNTLHGGLSSLSVSNDLSFCWSEFTGTPETGSDTTFNVGYITVHFRRISSTEFGVRVVCGRGNQPANTGSVDFANGQTPAQVAATVEGRADGSSPYAYDSGFPEWTVTCGSDPSTIFAQYPFFMIHNPFPFPLYALHSSCFASL